MCRLPAAHPLVVINDRLSLLAIAGHNPCLMVAVYESGDTEDVLSKKKQLSVYYSLNNKRSDIVDVNQVNSLAECMQIEMPKCRLTDVDDIKVSSWDEFRELFHRNGCDLTTLDRHSMSAQRALQVAVLSKLVQIIPRTPFNIAIRAGFSIALRGSGAYANKLEFPWVTSALWLLSVAGPVLAGYGAYSSGRGLIAAVVSTVVAWWLLSKPYKRKIQHAITRAALESNSAFNLLWFEQQYAIYDVASKQTYDAKISENWAQVLVKLSGAAENNLVSKEARWENTLSDIKAAKESS